MNITEDGDINFDRALKEIRARNEYSDRCEQAQAAADHEKLETNHRLSVIEHELIHIKHILKDILDRTVFINKEK